MQTVTVKSKAEWLAWFEKYGAEQFLDALLSNVEGAQGTCAHCAQSIYLDFTEGGGVGDWKTKDGDYGCLDSPDTGEQGTGSHFPIRLGDK